MQYVRNFVILPFNEYSDHAGLHIELTTKQHSRVSSEPSTPLKQQNIMDNKQWLVWESENHEAFRNDISSALGTLCELTNRIIENCDTTELDSIVSDFSNFVYEKSLSYFAKKKCCQHIKHINETNGLMIIVRLQVKNLRMPGTLITGVNQM